MGGNVETDSGAGYGYPTRIIFQKDSVGKGQGVSKISSGKIGNERGVEFTEDSRGMSDNK